MVTAIIPGQEGTYHHLQTVSRHYSRIRVRPDLFVEIRSDLLHEIDGPMLQHGLQERHGQRLMSIPRTRSEKPDSLLLQRRYEQFRAAS